MKQLSRKNLDELAKVMPVISEMEQRSFIGGGSGTFTDPYTEEEYERMIASGTWEGGYVLFDNSSEPVYAQISDVDVVGGTSIPNQNTGNPVYDSMYQGGYEIGYEAGLTGGLLETAKAMAISGMAAFGMGHELGNVNYDLSWLIQGVIRGYFDGKNSRPQ